MADRSIDATDTTNARIAWFHCFSGVAGDMALGSLLDAGADIDEVRALCNRIPVEGWQLDVDPVMRCGIAASKARVRTDEPSVVHRTAAHIIGLVEEARLPDRVAARAIRTFELLAEVEGRLHRRPPSQVHFHEVGGLDAIVDVVGTCAALEVLGIDAVYGSPVATGRGMVRSAHGLIPNPAPAVVDLLVGAPTYGIDVPIELTTPTGAALLAANVTAWGALPPMVIEASGFGAGDRETDGRPNVVQVVVGERIERLERGQPIVQLEVNVDDATGETLAHAVAAMLDAGANDAWVTPVLMKKGRPAHTVHALVDVALAAQVSKVLTDETGSLGVRGQMLERWPAERQIHEVEVDGRPIRVKVSAGRVKVEHDDAARVARLAGRPLREVVSLAEEAWRRTTAVSPIPLRPDSGDDDDHDHPA